MQEENKVKKSFHKNMKAELKKVIWPTGKQVIKSTFATISFVLLISVILVALNFAFSFLNEKWFDLVLPGNGEQNQGAVVSGDVVSGDVLTSGDAISGDETTTEVPSGESNVSANSGDENTITE